MCHSFFIDFSAALGLLHHLGGFSERGQNGSTEESYVFLSGHPTPNQFLDLITRLFS